MRMKYDIFGSINIITRFFGRCLIVGNFLQVLSLEDNYYKD